MTALVTEELLSQKKNLSHATHDKKDSAFEGEFKDREFPKRYIYFLLDG